MLPYLLDWAHLALRWLHLIAGAAWIGASFYFNWLNNNVRPVARGPDGKVALGPEGEIVGDVWSVHGGAFYRALKKGYTIEKLPEPLHWFYWEAYTTWLSGVGLLLVVYWLNASAWMAGPLAAGPAVGVGVGSLVAAWLVYDGLCRTPLVRRPAAFGVVMYALLTAAAWGLFQLLPGRAAYMHVGAMMGTIMAANVFFVIIPSQRKMVDAAARGEAPDLAFGQAGGLRSLHNNYFTLPTLFVMVSNHFPFTYGNGRGWLVLAAVGAVGLCIRHVFNRKGQGKPYGAFVGLSVAGGVAIVIAMAPTPHTGPTVAWAEVAPIVASRCAPCHATTPTQAGFVAPPLGLVLDGEAKARGAAAKIATMVSSSAMPLGNLTGMTPEERALVVAWAQEP